MKIFFYSLFIIILQSCGTIPKSKVVDSDYEIAQMALSNFSKWDKYWLLAEPSTFISDDYLNGFFAEGINFSQEYKYKTISSEKWERSFFDDANIIDKLKIIKDYDKVPKFDNIEDVDIYISMSRPLYSTDGKYAVIIINTFTNHTLDTILSGYGFVYEKIDGAWKLHLKFIPYLV